MSVTEYNRHINQSEVKLKPKKVCIQKPYPVDSMLRENKSLLYDLCKSFPAEDMAISSSRRSHLHMLPWLGMMGRVRSQVLQMSRFAF